jgi:hypothetical protein
MLSALYRRLIDALPGRIVWAQAQLLQLATFKRGRRAYAVLNRISQLSLDFLVLRPDTSVVAVVELDDASHKRGDRIRADCNKARALKSAGTPLVRWDVSDSPCRRESHGLGPDPATHTLAGISDAWDRLQS